MLGEINTLWYSGKEVLRMIPRVFFIHINDLPSAMESTRPVMFADGTNLIISYIVI